MLTLNSLDLQRGVLAQVELSPWVTAGGAGSFLDLGAVRGLAVDIKQTFKQLEADNSLYPLDAYPTKAEATITFEVLQADLKKLANALGELVAKVQVTGATSAIFPWGQPTGGNYWQLRISAPNVGGMKPGSDTYHTRTHTIWRCVQEPALNMKLVRGDETVYKFTFHALLDTTVTASATQDQIGKIADTV
jgi:hypothetical protein